MCLFVIVFVLRFMVCVAKRVRVCAFETHVFASNNFVLFCEKMVSFEVCSWNRVLLCFGGRITSTETGLLVTRKSVLISISIYINTVCLYM